MKNIFFFGSGHGGLAAIRSLQAAYQSIEVLSDDDEIHRNMRKSDHLLATIDEVGSPQGVIAGYLGILSKEFVHEHEVLNVHYSLLPKYRGLHSVVWAMLNLEPQLGYTVHVVNERMDDGPIVHQQGIVYSGDTSWELMKKLDALVEQDLGRVASAFFSGKLPAVEQDTNLATWVPRRNLESCIIDFSWEANRLKALFKALVSPYPLPSLIIRGKRYEVVHANVVQRAYFCDLGRVVNIDTDGAWIKCFDSLLHVRGLLDDAGSLVIPSDVLRLGMRLQENWNNARS